MKKVSIDLREMAEYYISGAVISKQGNAMLNSSLVDIFKAIGKSFKSYSIMVEEIENKIDVGIIDTIFLKKLKY